MNWFDYPHLQRLNQQMQFIAEIDRAKQIWRQNRLGDASRQENDAEHSWHLAMMALILAEYAEKTVDVSRVIKMLLVHDLVEIDAGDTFAYDDIGQKDKAERETKAADRIFGLLPADQRDEIRALWEEFEARNTPESRFAVALDRLHPMLQNYWSGGHAWQEHDVDAGQVRARNAHIRDGSETLWQYAKTLIQDAVHRGFLTDERPSGRPDSPVQ